MKDNLGKRQKTSAQLIKIALEQLINRMDYELITVARICQKATVSRNTFYRLFDSKADVMEAILKEKIELCISKSQVNLIWKEEEKRYEGDREAYLTYFEYWKKEEKLLNVLHKQHMFDRFYYIQNKYFTNDVMERISLSHDFGEILKRYYYKLLSFSTSSVIDEWAVSGFKETPQELADMIMVIYGSMSVASKRGS